MKTIFFMGMLAQALTMNYSDGSKSIRIYQQGQLVDVIWLRPIRPMVVLPGTIVRFKDIS